MSDPGGQRGWGARIRDVGEAFLAVVRAEVAALAGDLGRSGRALVGALVWALAAAALLFWTLGLLIYVAIELLALQLPRWGAASIVLGIFALASALLLMSVRRKLSAIEPPDVTVRRRMAENRRWWSERVAPDDPSDLDDRTVAAEPAEGTGEKFE